MSMFYAKNCILYDILISQDCTELGTSLAFQRLRLHVSTAGCVGLIPGQGNKIPHAAWCSQKVKKKKRLHRIRLSFLYKHIIIL